MKRREVAEALYEIQEPGDLFEFDGLDEKFKENTETIAELRRFVNRVALDTQKEDLKPPTKVHNNCVSSCTRFQDNLEARLKCVELCTRGVPWLDQLEHLNDRYAEDVTRLKEDPDYQKVVNDLLIRPYHLDVKDQGFIAMDFLARPISVRLMNRDSWVALFSMLNKNRNARAVFGKKFKQRLIRGEYAEHEDYLVMLGERFASLGQASKKNRPLELFQEILQRTPDSSTEST